MDPLRTERAVNSRLRPAIPVTNMTQDPAGQTDAAIAKLIASDGTLTPHFQAYTKYEQAYKDRLEARDKAYSAALGDAMKLQQWPMDGVSYQEDVDTAWDRWMALGFKIEIEKAIAALVAQGADEAIALVARAKEKYRSSLHEF